MALSISRTPLAAANAAAPVDWRSRVSDAVGAATLAVAAADSAALDAVLAGVGSWDHEERRFQALGAVVETVLGGSAAAGTDQWLRLYLCAAEHVLRAL